MRQATAEQIEEWLNVAARYERTRLPSDHPMHLRYGGAALAEIKRPAMRAIDRLRDRDLYDAAEIKRRAEGGVDYAAHVAAETAKRDRYRLALAVNEALATATMEQMQAALAALKGAS